MDPVTPFGQLTEQTFTIFVRLANYYGDVRNAPAQSKELRDEFQTVSDLLKSLNKTLATDSVVFVEHHDSLKRSAAEFKEILDDLEERIKPKRTMGFARLKWPLSKAENETIISKIERHKSIFSFALSISQTYVP